MTAAKIAISLPPEQLRRVQQAVKRGRAESISAYISRALVEQDREESLQTLLDDLVRQFGKPTRRDEAWAERVLKRRLRA